MSLLRIASCFLHSLYRNQPVFRQAFSYTYLFLQKYSALFSISTNVEKRKFEKHGNAVLILGTFLQPREAPFATLPLPIASIIAVKIWVCYDEEKYLEDIHEKK